MLHLRVSWGIFLNSCCCCARNLREAFALPRNMLPSGQLAAARRNLWAHPQRPRHHDPCQDQGCVSASAHPPAPPGTLLGMTREEAQAIYRAGEETVVRVLVELSTRVDQLTADFALSKPAPKSLRPPSQRPTGSQPGHTLREVEKPTAQSPIASSAAKSTNCPSPASQRTQTPGAPQANQSPNLLDRFRNHSPSILAFLHDFAAPARSKIPSPRPLAPS